MNMIAKYLIQANEYINSLLKESDTSHTAFILSIQVKQTAEWIGRVDDQIMNTVCARLMGENQEFMDDDPTKWDQIPRGTIIDSMVIKMIKDKEV